MVNLLFTIWYYYRKQTLAMKEIFLLCSGVKMQKNKTKHQQKKKFSRGMKSIRQQN